MEKWLDDEGGYNPGWSDYRSRWTEPPAHIEQEDPDETHHQ
jgi:hypothetical protein